MNPINPKWPGLNDAEWQSLKDSIATACAGPSHVQKGIAFDVVTSRLLAEIDALRALVRTQDANLSAVLARGTELTDEVRSLKAVVGERVGISGRRLAIVNDVIRERWRGDMKHNEVEAHVDVADGTGHGPAIESLAKLRVVISMLEATRDDTWADRLLEEVVEALAEKDPANLRAELVQVASLACKWVEAIDLRGAK